MYKKNKNIILFLFLLTIFNTCNAETIDNKNNIGEMHIKEITDSSKTSIPIENDTNVGLIKINENENKPKNEPIKPLTKNSENIKEKLEIIVSNQNNKEYEIALDKISDLINQYPEYVSLRKWKAIYQNRLFEYEESNNTLDNITNIYPLSIQKIQNDKMILAYKIDNDIHIGNYNMVESELNTLNILINNTDNNKTIEDIKEKELYSIIYYYDMFLYHYYKNEDVNKEELDTLWNKIPKKNQKNLDIFYGFNLDDLEYIYGKFYNRKDLLKQYVQQENTSQNKNIIEKVKDAKSIIFTTY